MLAYAAQGLTGDAASASGGHLREFLTRAAAALNGMGELLVAVIERQRLEPEARYRECGGARSRRARQPRRHRARARPASISSQLVDNLNASIHLRALLTDLFLIDEILKPNA